VPVVTITGAVPSTRPVAKSDVPVAVPIFGEVVKAGSAPVEP
jgi:hypothetical protein